MEINKIGNRKTTEKKNKTKSIFFERSTKLAKTILLGTLTKNKRQNIWIIVRNKSRDITREFREIKRIVGNYYTHFYINKLDHQNRLEKTENLNQTIENKNWINIFKKL